MWRWDWVICFGLVFAQIAADTVLKRAAVCATNAGRDLVRYVQPITAGAAAGTLAHTRFMAKVVRIVTVSRFNLTVLPARAFMRSRCGR